MNTFIEKCLEDIENRINPEIEEELYRQWVEFLEDNYEGQIFSPQRPATAKPAFDWMNETIKHFPEMSTGLDDVPVNQALDNYELMILQQFWMVSNRLANADGTILDVRCNYGTSILPSLFGVELFRMSDEMNTLPANKPFNDRKIIRQFVMEGTPRLDSELVNKSFELAKQYKKIAQQYPKIGKYVHIFHPDTQGVISVSELIWGSDIFIAFYEMPDLVKDLMDVVADTYVAFMEKWAQIIPFKEDYNTHWGFLHKGKIMLRCDSVMNISPPMYDEFIFPHQQKLFERYGGGLHFCGKGDHYIDKACSIDQLYSVQMSQPEYNDMGKIYSATVDRGKTLLGFSPDAGGEAVKSGRNLRGLVHCDKTYHA